MMKTSILIIVILAILIGCTEKEDEIQNEINTTTVELDLIKTKYKGCFEENHKGGIQEENDTLYYTISGDSLILSATLNYNCCGKLKDSIELGASEVNIYISDTNPSACNCICIFDFEYYFINVKNIHFNVYLNVFNEDEYSLWQELDYNE